MGKSRSVQVLRREGAAAEADRPPGLPAATPEQLRQSALEHERAGRFPEALAAAWSVLDAEPADIAAKARVAGLLRDYPHALADDRQAHLHALLIDAEVDPGSVRAAGWILLARNSQPFAPDAPFEPERLAAWLEGSALAQDLLREAPVPNLDVEIALTRLRRWLLLERRWNEFPRSTDALAAQARGNQGAWLFEEEERAAAAAEPDAPIARCYPTQPGAVAGASDFDDAVTRAVAGQYEGWPYPIWTRITTAPPTTLANILAEVAPDAVAALPRQPEVLIAGCGTGREATIWARRLPEARITAIDFSGASLRYARQHCTPPDLDRIRFHQMDLHRVAELGVQFDMIGTSGVLHHLPDPEGGWRALCGVLKPGGLMRVMVYSRRVRVLIKAARAIIGDLVEAPTDRPVDADTLRAVRRRLIERAPGLLRTSTDSFTLSGVHDLFLHRHEDAFDVPRIRSAIDALGLTLLRFNLPSRRVQARYLEQNPADVRFRDFDAWAKFESENPMLFLRMYDFWCGKPRA